MKPPCRVSSLSFPGLRSHCDVWFYRACWAVRVSMTAPLFRSAYPPVASLGGYFWEQQYLGGKHVSQSLNTRTAAWPSNTDTQVVLCTDMKGPIQYVTSDQH